MCGIFYPSVWVHQRGPVGLQRQRAPVWLKRIYMVQVRSKHFIIYDEAIYQLLLSHYHKQVGLYNTWTVDWTMDSHHFIATQTLLKAFYVILDILPITLYSGTGHSKKDTSSCCLSVVVVCTVKPSKFCHLMLALLRK